MYIQTLDDVQAALSLISSSEILAYDPETTGLNVRQDKVIGFGVHNGNSGFYLPLFSYDAELQELKPSGLGDHAHVLLLALSQKKLVMFNASFDARVTFSNFNVDLVAALYADAMLMKHTCDEEFPFGLKEIATKLWGTGVKDEKEAMQASIKANGGTATEYYKADSKLIGEYCLADCLLTMRVFDHYGRELDSQGLTNFYYDEEVLPLYKEVVIPMELAGVRLDLPLIERSCAEIVEDITALEAEIQAQIAPHLALFTDWFLNKDYPLKSAGRIHKLMKSGLSLREAQLEQWRIDSDGRNMFNLNSKFHLKKLFFDTLGEEPLSRTPTGQPQVDEEFLESIAGKYDWVPRLIEYNKLTKLKGTYIERFLEEHENGRFYPSFQMHRTVSGRLAGDLQQLPRPLDEEGIVAKHTNRIRQFIIADEGSLLCSADYEQLEPSIFSHTSGDPALQAIFNSGTDFYSEVALRTEKLQGVSSDKKAPNYLGKVDKTARQRAKAYALGIAYGMTGYKLQFEIGVTQDEAESLVTKYLEAFPSLASFMADSKTEAVRDGRVATESGRVRRLYAAKRLHETYGPGLSNSLELWKRFNTTPATYARAKSDRKVYVNLLNNSINFKVQGLAASIVNRASIKIARHLKSMQLDARIVMQVHDELVLNVPIEEQQLVSKLVKQIMENVTTLSVPLRTEPQFGRSFRDCK